MDTETLDGCGMQEDSRSGTFDPKEDGDIKKLYYKLKESRKPLPYWYFNYPNWLDGNAKIRFDGLPLGSDTYYLRRMIPRALNQYVVRYKGPDLKNAGYGGVYLTTGFVTFMFHEVAKHFLHSFNGKTHNGFTYQLSWAPFPRWKKFVPNGESAKLPYADSDSSDSDSCEVMSDSSDESDDNGLEAEDKMLSVSADIYYSKFDSEFCKVEAREAEKRFEEWYSYLHKEFHDSEGPWRFASRKPVDVMPTCDGCEPIYDGVDPTSIIYLLNVDPNLTEGDVGCIFKKFGDCVTHLPDEGYGFGYVEFGKQVHAENALKKLEAVLRRQNFCCMTYGHVADRDPYDSICRSIVIECPVFGESCPRLREKAEPQGVAVGFSAGKVQIVVPATKAKAAAQFYKDAFGAEEVTRSTYCKDESSPDVICVEMKMAGYGFLVCDQTDDSAITADSCFALETYDVEAALTKALGAGAVVTCEDGILCQVKDPFGVVWSIASSGKKKSKCNDPLIEGPAFFSS